MRQTGGGVREVGMCRPGLQQARVRPGGEDRVDGEQAGRAVAQQGPRGRHALLFEALSGGGRRVVVRQVLHPGSLDQGVLQGEGFYSTD